MKASSLLASNAMDQGSAGAVPMSRSCAIPHKPAGVAGKPGYLRWSALILCSLACAGCAVGGSSLEQRVEQQDMQLRQMQPQQADTWNQLQAMRQEVNELKAQLEALNGAGGAGAIADRVRQHDAALRQMDTNMALNLDLGEPITAMRQPVHEATQGIPMTGAPDSSLYGGTAQAAPTAEGSYGMPPETAPAQYQPAQAPSETTWGQADPRPEVQVPQKDISLALFDSGVNSYNARNYEAASRSFTDFLKNYPDHSQTAEAQYYLAECDFQRNKFPEAALAYDVVIKKYPKSSSAPGAYLKQAICFSKMNQGAAARARMQEIISKFPNSSEAARARSFLKTNK